MNLIKWARFVVLPTCFNILGSLEPYLNLSLFVLGGTINGTVIRYLTTVAFLETFETKFIQLCQNPSGAHV